MESKSYDIWVGLFVAVGLIALVFLALKAGNLATFSTSATYTLNARFDNIGGLKPRAPVKSAGVTVGRVEEIMFDDKTFQANAVLAMDARYKFPKDTSAKILTAGLLGEQYIGLEAGGDAQNLAGGDRIKMTQSAVVLENLIGQFLFNKAAETPKDSPAAATTAPKN
ncbi:MAG: outer rane lipid asymmetry maintenance protein MlaD [Pseudomonadota bacterium]|jgi:phospholipid/cholesterol/gamma-HCH transport system substrate-binding protein